MQIRPKIPNGVDSRKELGRDRDPLVRLRNSENLDEKLTPFADMGERETASKTNRKYKNISKDVM